MVVAKDAVWRGVSRFSAPTPDKQDAEDSSVVPGLRHRRLHHADCEKLSLRSIQKAGPVAPPRTWARRTVWERGTPYLLSAPRRMARAAALPARKASASVA